MSNLKAVPVNGGALLFPRRRLIRCLGVDFIRHRPERAFAFALSEAAVSRETTDKPPRPAIAPRQLRDSATNASLAARLYPQALWVASKGLLAASANLNRPVDSHTLTAMTLSTLLL